MGLLDRARKVLGSRPAQMPVRTQVYRVACPEGHVLHGQRTEGYQALRCPECDQGIFVLPRSPLPEPAPPRTPGAAARRAARPDVPEELVLENPPSPAEVAWAKAEHAATRPRPGPVASPAPADAEPDAEIEWVDEVDEPAAPPLDGEVPAEPEKTRRRKGGSGAASPSRAKADGAPRKKKVGPEPEPVPPGMVALEERVGLADWARGHKNALIFVGVIAIVAGTVTLRVRQRRIENLPQVVEIGRIKGLDALDAGDFATAKQVLAEAAKAVEGLGGDVEGADAIRQGAREAALLADFKGGGLGDLVEEAAKYNPPDAWPAQFDAIYKGRSEVFMATVTKVPDPAKPDSAYTIDWPIYYGPGPRPEGAGRLDLAGFKLLDQARPRVGDVVTFGARLASIRFDPLEG
ncbi:MAG TPA: hypothetical protein VGH33_13350 [Isosphaeraceae bacterium]